MDAKREWLEKDLEKSLKRATEVAAELQKMDQDLGTPHYDQTELPEVLTN
ncbi:MAG: hypothetical protein IT427_08900 [Pirellulales bacterium]|nr:hypothetical protein [Pirellulales bacterium]